ncbi:glycosyltransferase [Sedimentibacter saalensis]|uniref:Glycosyltransferase involved in cell wall biosynthesis n=1 Tax=Sedimentibacter saalensis TaxID=130788 RepID=A0A562J8Y0_9FIRM|nr:glycosyltransferase [Sedimentibacter saalensis]TWH79355.1 glycosyltransferase involved in cell wall biosynthesis [Sedimentibacter saalensis]
MKLLWISGLAWRTKSGYERKLNGPGAVSGSIFQQSIIDGLEKGTSDVHVNIICDYPEKCGFVSKGKEWAHREGANDKYVFYVNIPIISLITKTITMCFSIFKYFNQNRDTNFAIGYLVHTPYLLALNFAKIINKKLKCILICPDLPEYMDLALAEKPFKKILKNLDKKIIDKALQKIDGYILFTDSMKERLPTEGKPSLLLEGVCSADDLNMEPCEKKHAFMYAGTLQKNFGIENIIDAFKLIQDKTVELWIFGDGDLRSYVIQQEKEDKRIKYFGFRDRKVVFEYEKSCKLLISVRNPTDEFTKYSFPSKTFEYMISGTPFLTTRLPGIPKEYEEYLILIDNNSIDTINRKMQEVLNNTIEWNVDFGERAKNFILKNKSANMQSRKVEEFLLNIKNVL